MSRQKTTYISWPPAEWPRLDQDLIPERAERPADPFADVSAAAAWTSETRRSIRDSYGRWLAFLRSTMPACLDLAPSDRITPDTIHRWLGTLGGLAPNTVVGLVSRLLTVARLADPSRDWLWLQTALGRLRRTAHNVREKKIVPPPEILNLGISLMDQVASGHWHRTKSGPATAIGQFRDGLILSTWSVTALRRGEFCNLRIGDDLLVSSDSARIEIPADRRKRSYVNLSIPIPEKVFPYLLEYLTRRALLAHARTHNGLWVDTLGRPIHFQGIARALGSRTQEAFGVYLPPHAMRYSAATWIALSDPAHVNTAMSVLGHTTLATTSDSYIMAQMVAAQRLVIANLRSLRHPEISERDGPENT